MKLVGLTQKLILAASLFSFPLFAEEPPKELYDMIPTFEKWESDPVLVQAVKDQNAQNLSLDEIKKRDEVWRNTSDVDSFMSAMMENKASKRLLELERSKPFLIELFLMDNQGANVAMTNKTSDYWQGDEAKFQESFKGGAGAVHVGDVEYDESTLAYLVQVSIPIKDGDKVIGAMTIGVNLDDL